VTGWCIAERLLDGICDARLLQRPNLERVIHSTWNYVRPSNVDILTIKHDENLTILPTRMLSPLYTMKYIFAIIYFYAIKVRPYSEILTAN